MRGIIKYKGYTFWHNVSIVEDKVWDFLQEKFPDAIIFPELLGADFVVLGENIPVEIQSTLLLPGKRENGEERIIIAHSQHEKMIQKQIRQNIEYFGICWFFFDSEYLRYLQNDITTKARINLDWLYRYIKEGKVKAFTINYDGVITEIYHKDLNFLSYVSTTCKTNRDEDFRILDRNKFKIISSVLRGYGFTSDELFAFRNNFGKDNGKAFIAWLQREGSSDREHLFGKILRIAGNLNSINKVLDRNNNISEYSIIHILSTIGLLKTEGSGKYSIVTFIDKFDIANYFPGYTRNENVWRSLKNRCINSEEFRDITTKHEYIYDQILTKILTEIRMLIDQSKDNRIILKSRDIIKELCLDYTKYAEKDIYIELKTVLLSEQITVKTAIHKSGENLLIMTKEKVR